MYAAQAASSILIAGDIGGWTTYHTGDEAMLAANIDGLRRLHPAVKITAFSFDPPWTSAHYGVRAIPPIGFWSLPDDDVRRNLWTELERGTADPGPDAARAIDAIADADAVIISGAGNLRAAWPPHIYDRAAIINIAKRCAKPVLVLGQTIGPDLDPPHREILSSALSCADLVGVREADSAALVRSLGVPEHLILEQLDDAWFLGLDPGFPAPPDPRPASPPRVAITFSSFDRWTTDETSLRAIAAELNVIACETRADLYFLPHWMERPGYRADSAAARAIIDLLDESARAVLLPVLEAKDCCKATREASLVISSRYHPVVFGLSGAVPCVAIYSDDYTRIRLQGALRHAGMEEYSISFESCPGGGLARHVLGAWRDRTFIKQQLLGRFHAWASAENAKWSRVARLLGWTAPV